MLRSLQHLGGMARRALRRHTPYRVSRRGLVRRSRWEIGVGFGRPPACFTTSAEVSNPVLTHADVTDVPAEFVADPFVVRRDATWYMFFELFSNQSGRGEIGLARSTDGLAWTYVQRVLAEPFHLSYPLVFTAGGEHFLVPETRTQRQVRLYRATAFPTEWTYVSTLLEGRPFGDTTVFRHADRWWLLTETGRATLRLYFADELRGAWTEHPMSPVVEGDARTARPAGRVVADGSRLFRYAQCCQDLYGEHVSALEIKELTTSSYREELVEAEVLGPRAQLWGVSRMHHIDAQPYEGSTWIALVDGLSP